MRDFVKVKRRDSVGDNVLPHLFEKWRLFDLVLKNVSNAA